jgi:uncharacterized protein with FMN-binding domain
MEPPQSQYTPEQSPQQSRSKRELITTLAVLIAIVIIVAAAILLSKRDGAGGSTANNSSSSNTNQNRSGSNAGGNITDTTYKDGTYTATGDYSSPGGHEEITVRLTIDDNTVTATSATSNASGGEAREYQNAFISGYKKLVIGKNIDDLDLSRVSGSSLTSQGFNDALEQIKSQAQS